MEQQTKMAQPSDQTGPFHEPTSFPGEKHREEHDVPVWVRPPRKPKRHLKTTLLVGLVVSGLLYWTSFNDTYLKQTQLPQMQEVYGDFENIIPSEKLQWQMCGIEWEFLCARLTVPMDYNRPLNASRYHPKVHIALMLAPGKRSDPRDFSISPLLINPGGPGGSGTFFVKLLAKYIQILVGTDQDVLGFDPRGVAATTPRADCFSDLIESSEPGAEYGFGDVDYLDGFYKRVSWLLSGTSIGLINSSAVALPKLDMRARTVAKLCKEKDSFHGDHSIFRHLNTPNVAKDMMSIIDAWDEWRESGFKMADSSYNLKYAASDSEHQNAPPSLKPDTTSSDDLLDTKGKLLYWGFSYGTLLGATFAAMFPDRVGRVILDGVVDADSYVEPVWAQSIIDTDTIFNSFPKYCHEGRENCTLYRSGDSYEDIKSRFEGALSKLKKSPISFIGPTSHYPFILTIDDVRMIFFTALYAPNPIFETVAVFIDAIVSENIYILEFMFSLVKKEAFCTAVPESFYPHDAQLSVMCSDKRYPLNETTSEIRHRFEMMSQNSSFADVWLSLMMGCDGWEIEAIDPPMRWGRHPAHSEKPINTSFPILFLSNTYDPVTPLYAAVKMSKKFTDSGLLELKTMGHCSLASVSACTMGVVSAYFKEGKVPAHPLGGLKDGKWEKCEADEWPFHRHESVVAEGGVMGEGMGREEEMRWAAKEMQRLIGEHGFFRRENGVTMANTGQLNAKCSARKGGK